MANSLKRVVDQFGNQVKFCCKNDLLFFTEDNKFVRVNPADEGNHFVDGAIYYHIASRIAGSRK